MRLLISLILVELSILSFAIVLSQTRAHEGFIAALARVRDDPHGSKGSPRDRDGAGQTFESMGLLFDMHLTPAQKAAALDPDLIDAILRVEGMYDPTRTGLFGQALRMQVRPGIATLVDLLDGRWTRGALNPNLHRRVDYLAKGWLGPNTHDCRDFWIDRRSEAAVALDALTTAECVQVRSAGEATMFAPVVAACLSLPVLAAPYPGNRLSSEQLMAYQRTRFMLLQQNRWFRGPFRATERGREP